MDILKIKGDELFTLERVSYVPDSKGVERLVCDYYLTRGPKSSLKIVFEGYAKSDILRVKKQFTFKSLMNMFDDRRIYPQGVMYLDGQFEKKPDENKTV